MPSFNKLGYFPSDTIVMNAIKEQYSKPSDHSQLLVKRGFKSIESKKSEKFQNLPRNMSKVSNIEDFFESLGKSLLKQNKESTDGTLNVINNKPRETLLSENSLLMEKIAVDSFNDEKEGKITERDFFITYPTDTTSTENYNGDAQKRPKVMRKHWENFLPTEMEMKNINFESLDSGINIQQKEISSRPNIRNITGRSEGNQFSDRKNKLERTVDPDHLHKPKEGRKSKTYPGQGFTDFKSLQKPIGPDSSISKYDKEGLSKKLNEIRDNISRKMKAMKIELELQNFLRQHEKLAPQLKFLNRKGEKELSDLESLCEVLLNKKRKSFNSIEGEKGSLTDSRIKGFKGKGEYSRIKGFKGKGEDSRIKGFKGKGDDSRIKGFKGKGASRERESISSSLKVDFRASRGLKYTEDAHPQNQKRSDKFCDEEDCGKLSGKRDRVSFSKLPASDTVSESGPVYFGYLILFKGGRNETLKTLVLENEIMVFKGKEILKGKLISKSLHKYVGEDGDVVYLDGDSTIYINGDILTGKTYVLETTPDSEVKTAEPPRSIQFVKQKLIKSEGFEHSFESSKDFVPERLSVHPWDENHYKQMSANFLINPWNRKFNI